ncbi:hypothetical protein F1654_01570 [Alkalicaulis satelles]|uniref:Uncharacterized protein n=1 Tax=Alkalicaulis satelles TaxID=2609175 RepID=A0A5M6ZN96_9PROT|nr:hypothetical protein [Alkalicaulis satelles]KAA5804718.1 hypothetical protein F1654_01570 [Alkalicaulis satelles]
MSAGGTAPARFSVRAALGLWLTVLSRRPAAFMSVSLVTVLTQAGLFWLTTQAYIDIALALENAGERWDEVSGQLQRANLMSWLYMIVFLPFWLWLETIWLRLFNNEERPWRFHWAELGHLALSHLVLFAIYMAALIVSFILMMVLMMIAGIFMVIGGDVDGSFFSAPMMVTIVLVPLIVTGVLLAKFSALPALAVMRRTLDLGAAWRATKGALWRTVAAWIIALGLYGGLIGGYALIGQNWSPVLRAHVEMMTASFDPALDAESFFQPYIAFASLSGAPDTAVWLVVDSLVVSVLYLVTYAIMRGIGVTLAWRAPVRDQAHLQGAGA